MKKMWICVIRAAKTMLARTHAVAVKTTPSASMDSDAMVSMNIKRGYRL